MTVQFQDLTTDKARIEFVRNKLETDERWMLRGMYAIFQRQTEDEKRAEYTGVDNGIGFTGADGGILASFTKQMLYRGFAQRMNDPSITIQTFLSEKQERYVRRKMPKYARQLVKIAKGQI